jgi:hypothetical protein
VPNPETVLATAVDGSLVELEVVHVIRRELLVECELAKNTAMSRIWGQSEESTSTLAGGSRSSLMIRSLVQSRRSENSLALGAIQPQVSTCCRDAVNVNLGVI